MSVTWLLLDIQSITITGG